VSGAVVWLTGLPQSGKSTLARRLATALGAGCCVLDSDEVRQALVPARGYDDAARDDFYATLANLAALLARQELIVLVPATANRRAYRARARAAAPRFVEVYVATPADDCARRDIKGLYRAELERLPGVGAPYEPPEAPDVIACGGEDAAAVAAVLAAL
jgi:adenylylsulfate kinase